MINVFGVVGFFVCFLLLAGLIYAQVGTRLIERRAMQVKDQADYNGKKAIKRILKCDS